MILRILTAIASTLAIALLVHVPAARGQSPTSNASRAPVRLADLEETALSKSPTVHQARAAVAVAEGKAQQAGLYPNPTLGYSADEIKTGPDLRGGKHGFFVDQTIVLGGKLGKRRDVLLRAVDVARAELDAAMLRTRNAVRLAYFEVLASKQRVSLLERLDDLVAEAVRTSHGLYNVGQADRPDVLEIEIEARQAQLDLVRARGQADQARALLALAVGDPAVAGAEFEGTVEDALPTIDATTLPAILEHSPQMLAAKADVERAEAAIHSSRAERTPDLFLRGGAEYNRELLEATNQPIGWQGVAEVGVSIPIFNRNQGEIAAADAELISAQEEVRRRELDLRTRFTIAFTAYADARRTTDAYRNEIIPKADEAYRLYLARYQQMTAAYPQVLIARRTWLRVNLEYVDALEQLFRSALPLRGLLVTDDMSDR